VFLTKLEPSGSLVYSALVGAIGEAPDCCSVSGIALDSPGTLTWPEPRRQQLDFGNSVDDHSRRIPIGPDCARPDGPFVAKISADGSKLIYSTLAATGITTPWH